ncbi:MAG TPA: adenylate/guanylate cyclase domain-containing protein [Methylomirabilota bacterium]|nr:adenylate/guanylate cyclase domain-containing protein [Methylomirabilota bacterium]
MTCPNCAAEIPAGFKFCGNCGQKLDAAPAPAAEVAAAAEPRPPVSPGGERREVAVLFADVSGFTKLSERFDPEDVHALMNECFAGLGEAIRDEEGYIDKYIGDAVMALFGAPVAHEDDPARACRAALAMQGFLSGFAERCEGRTGVPIRMRIGIHCGLVLAGGVGSDVRMDYSVMGDTVNLASRLESNAPPGGILVSAEVARRARGRFEFGPSRVLTVKGKEQPVQAYDLVGEIADVDPRGRDGLSVELVGRDAELATLVRHWDTARRGGERWVEIRGEMGIGKTRLVEEGAYRVGGARLLPVVATPEVRRRPFGLARRLVLAVLRLLTGEAVAPASRDAFAAGLAPLGADLEPFVDALWHLAAPSRLSVPAPDPDPQTLRRTIEHGVATLLGRLGAHLPDLTLFLDSYELTDEASAALLDAMRAAPDGLPLPIVATSREDRPGARSGGAVLRPGRLPEVAAGELLDRLVRGVELPAGLRRDILERAAGVPLFIEEMVRALVDQAVLTPRPDGTWCWGRGAEPTSVSLPASIRAAMVTRLDRLGKAEGELLRQCAVQGVEFDLGVAELMRRAPNRGGPPAAALLPELERHGLLAPLGGTRWAFRQPLMQEACYETVLLRERRALHGETADALCAAAGGPEGVAPEPLAHHYERAERWGPAAEANLRAGNRAAELFVNDEAIRRYQRALDALERVGPAGDAEQRVAALVHRGAGRVHLRVGAYGRAEEHARRMRAGATGPADRAEADRLLARACAHTGRTQEAEELLLAAAAEADGAIERRAVRARSLLDLAELYHRANRTGEALARVAEGRAAAPSEDRLAAVRADMLEGRIAHTEGRFADAATLYGRAYEAAEEIGSLSHRARAANNLGTAARDLGDYTGARRHFERALQIWERTGDTEGIAGAHNNLGNLAMSQGDLALAREHHGQSVARFRQIGNVHGAALAQANLAILAMEEDDGAGAVASAEAALETLGDSGNALLRGLILVVLGETRLACGETAAATALFERVRDEYDEARHPLALAGAWRGLGRVGLARGTPAEALPLLDRALEAFERLTRAQEAARTLLYRAEALWQLGQPDRACADLEAALARFVAMRADRDVRRVERLLRELAGAPPAAPPTGS